MSLSEVSKKRAIFIVIGVMVSVLLSALDSTIVGTAMPKIISDLKGMEHYTWPFTAYMLASTAVIPIFGKLADIYGRRPIYIIGLVTFVLASALCGLSQNMIQLIIFRGMQGIGGGILMSTTFAIIGDIFPPAERGKFMGLIGAMFGLASVVGPSLGGFITDNLNWRWVFYVNLPVGIAAFVIMWFALPSIINNGIKRVIDYAGAATLVFAIIPMLLAFTWAGQEYEWLSTQIIGLLAFSSVMIALFIYVESRAEEPILPLNLFKNSIFNIANLSGFLMNAGMMGTILFIPLFVQGVIGASATDSGMVTTPMMLSLVVGSIIAGQIISRTGKYKLIGIFGFLVNLVGMYMLSRLNIDSTNREVIVDMIVSGVGLGINMPVFNIAVQNAFPHSQLGIVTAANQFFRNIGGTIGAAVMGSVMLSTMNDSYDKMDLSKLPPQLQTFLRNPQAVANPDNVAKIKKLLPPQMLQPFEQLMIQVKTVLADSIHEVFVIGIVIVGVAFVVTLFLKEIPLKKKIDDDKDKEVILENLA